MFVVIQQYRIQKLTPKPLQRDTITKKKIKFNKSFHSNRCEYDYLEHNSESI